MTSKYMKRRSSAVKLHNDEYNHSATSLDDDYGYHDRKAQSPKRSPLKPPSNSYFLDYEPERPAAMKRSETYCSSNYASHNSSVYSVTERNAYDPPKSRSNSTGSYAFTPSNRNRSGTNASRNSNNPWADSLPEEKAETSHSDHMSQQELFEPSYLDFLATKKAPPPPPVQEDDTDNLTSYHSREETGRYNTEGVTDRYDAFDDDGYGFSRVKTNKGQGNLKKLGRRLSIFRS